ncbi:MAG TPA: S8 family serine peptidase, partial [Vicinamibacteria bacterium]|nr:S8 family serine peptidase [Vicinamibacteria bacterium]
MPSRYASSPAAPADAAERPYHCPTCHRSIAAGSRVPASGMDPELVSLVSANTPGWELRLGLCLDCVRRFTTALDSLRHHAVSADAMPILPTPLRIGAPDEYRGRGVTIAFLDSGFFAHPDLVEPADRIVRYVDITNARRRREDLESPDVSSWHGMMTSVVACGNGTLSTGFYRGVASEARLVLVKVGEMSRVTHENLQRGLDWVVRNRKRYDIRIVNVSCGGDYQASYLRDALSQAAERATRAGILVCAAVGNQGQAPGHPVLPPASAPSALTVGGVDDHNRLAFAGYDMYHSSYGPTVDGLQKPEVIAPGIWVAAPILPGTPTAAQAQLLATLATAKDGELSAVIEAHQGVDGDLDAALSLDAPLIRQLVAAKMKGNNVISGAYKHVDGTSFAAPIVASIAAQMIEANPELVPQDIKRLLIDTARRIPGVSVDRQGWGVVDA